jgi:arginyl-tRNA--protein-N-Asp/Glu arginylyltransferase
MNRDRLKYILNFSEKLQVVTYTEDDTVLGYVFEVLDKDMSHFWFSFYDLKLVNTSLGMWLLLDMALHAQKENKKYFYIGTAYGDKGLYKTNFKDLEFWDGNRWVSDVLILKKLCKVDN